MQFEEHLRRLWVLEMARDVDHLEHLLGIYNGEPDYWAEDVEAYLEAIRQRVEAGPDVSPVDMVKQKGSEGFLVLVQELVRRYGELLVSWPAIVAGARRLKEAGVVL
jgi:hypothetical protein